MNRSPGWYLDPSHQYRLRWWVLRLRWWDGEMWASFTAVRSLSWVPIALTGAAGLWVWLVGAVLSLMTAQGTAEMPQPNQEMWVLIALWLPAAPVAGAIVAAVITLVFRGRRRSAAVAAANAFLWIGVAVAYLAAPKPP
jgi:hypothetical protein